MYRFAPEDITRFYLRLDIYTDPRKTYIMQPPVNREPDSVTMHLGKPNHTQDVIRFDTVKSHPNTYWFTIVRRDTKQIVNRANVATGAVVVAELEGCRYVTVDPTGVLRIYTIGITVDGLGDIPWNYIPHGIKLKLTEA